MTNLLQTLVTAPNPNIPELRPGDTVKVHNRIVEGTTERVQIFQGTVMRIHGSGDKCRFTVRRIASHGVAVERTFFYKSPRLEKVEVIRQSHVRRAQLYYLRGRSGKAARLRGKRFVKPAEEAAASESAPEASAETK